MTLLAAPQEAKIADEIAKSTPMSDQLESGYCQETIGVFADKAMVMAAVAYRPAVRDRQQITGYCTLCVDGTYSPSCAVGRGACSFHGEIAQYNYPRYMTIPGKAAIQAQPAQYSYAPRTYQDSANYVKPAPANIDSITKSYK